MIQKSYTLVIRETREWWPLLTFETEANGVSKSTNEQGSFLGWFVGPILAVQEVFILPWLLLSAQYKIVFPSQYTISVQLSTSPSKLGKQSCQVVCLLVCVSDGDCTKAEFRNPDKSLESFPPCYSQFYSFTWDLYFFKLTQPLKASVKEKGGKLDRKPYPLHYCLRNPNKTIPPSLLFKKSKQKSQAWALSRLCPETSTWLYVHEFGFYTDDIYTYCHNLCLVLRY